MLKARIVLYPARRKGEKAEPYESRVQRMTKKLKRMFPSWRVVLMWNERREPKPDRESASHMRSIRAEKELDNGEGVV